MSKDLWQRLGCISHLDDGTSEFAADVLDRIAKSWTLYVLHLLDSEVALLRSYSEDRGRTHIPGHYSGCLPRPLFGLPSGPGSSTGAVRRERGAAAEPQGVATAGTRLHQPRTWARRRPKVDRHPDTAPRGRR